MIAYLEGKIKEKWNNSCILLTSAGIGYELTVPAHTFNDLPDPGENIGLFTSLNIREDAWDLYAFSTFEERQVFKILTSINKVGSRTALAILSIYRPDELKSIVVKDDLPALTRVPGIGNKTAQHILLELKYKLASLNINPESASQGERQNSPIFNDILAAMTNLGYSSEECSVYIKDILQNEPDLDVSGAIRQTLKAIAKGKS